MSQDHTSNGLSKTSPTQCQEFFINAPIGIITTTPEGQLLAANPAMARMFGYDSPDELLESVKGITTELYADLSDRKELIRLLKENDEVLNYECRGICRDKSTLWTSISVSAVRDKNGRIIHFQSFLTDITSRKQAEERLRESEERFRAIVEGAPDAMFVQTEKRFAYLNPQALELFGTADKSELLGQPVSDRFHPDFQQLSKERLRRLYQERQPVKDKFDQKYLRLDGSEIWVETTGQPVTYQGKEGALVFVRDITERKQMEEALRNSEETLRTTLQSIGDGVISTDMKGLIASMNPVAESLTGWSEKAATGQRLETVFRIINEQTRQQVESPVTNVLKSGQIVGLANHTLLIARDGREIPIADSGAPIRNDHGEISGVVLVFRDQTKERAAQKALEESERRFQKMLGVVPDMISIHSPEMDILYSNWQGFGAVPETMRKTDTKCYKTYRGYSDVCPDCLAKKVLRTKQPTRKETELPDGTWVDLRVIPLLDKNNNVEMFMEWVRDITDRKQAEEELLESEEMHRKLLQTVPDLIIRTDLEGTITFVNEMAFPGLRNHPEASICGKNISSFIAEHDRPHALENARARLEKDIGPQEYQLQFDNVVMDAGINGAVILDKDSRPAEMVYVIRDITDRKHSEEALRQSEVRARAQRMAIADLSLDQEVLEGELSSALERITETVTQAMNIARAGIWILSDDCSELRCLSLYEAEPDRHSSGMVLETRAFPRYFEAVLSESRLCAHDAQTDPRTSELSEGYLVPLNITSMLDAGIQIDGRLAGVVCLEHIGEPRQWHSDEGAFASTIAALVAQVMANARRRQAESENQKLQAQLLQAQKMESIGILAGGVAHDFNNLLQTMKGNLEFLDMKLPDDHPGKNRVQTIQKSMDRAANLVKQMLLFSRTADIQIQVLDLNQEIQDSVKLLESSIPRMISIELNLDENVWPINADPIQVDQVLLNLGTNAADAMFQGGRLIIETANATLDQDFVRNHNGAKPGKYVLMSVSDTGTGMGKETLQHVFEPFFTTKEPGKGTGLGLASVYGIVKAHEGYILCYSEPGQGTAFKIYWPVAEKGEIRLDEIQTEQAVSQDGTETLLVADDDDQIRELTEEALKDHGYQTLSADSGEQALEIYSGQRGAIDLVVLDLNMPGMGGYNCLQEILRINPEARVLIASGYSASGQAKDIHKSGAAGFIGKPFQLSELLAKIRKVLDGD